MRIWDMNAKNANELLDKVRIRLFNNFKVLINFKVSTLKG